MHRITEPGSAFSAICIDTAKVEPPETPLDPTIRTSTLVINELSGSDDPQAVISTVWNRQLGSRFVQASRAEIAKALPTIRFPEAVPEAVRWVTSQLVYDPATGLLDADTSSAFGFWTVEPYTADSGQLAVLRVGPAPDGTGAARSDVVPIVVPDGLSLGWTEAGLRYELFCQASVTDEVCNAIVDSFLPLSDLLVS